MASRDVEVINFRGQELSFREISKISGVGQNLIRTRYRSGDREEDLVRPSGTKTAHTSNKPKMVSEYKGKIPIKASDKRGHSVIKLMIAGEEHTFSSLERKYNLSYSILYYHYLSGDLEEYISGKWNNARLTRIEYKGKIYTLKQLEKITGIKYSTLFGRYNKDTDLFKKVVNRPHMKIEYQGKILNMYQLSRETGIGYGALKYRYNKGLRGEDLIKKK